MSRRTAHLSTPPSPYRSLFAGWRRVTMLIWRTSPVVVASLALLTCVSAVMPSARLVVGKFLIDTVVDARLSHGEATTWLPWLLALGLVSVIAVAVSHVATGISTLFAIKVAHRVGRAVLEKAATLDLTHFERSEFYDTLQRAGQDGSSRPLAIVALQFQLVQHVVGLCTVGLVLLTFRWQAFLVMVAALLPQIRIQLALARAGYDLQRGQTTARRRQHYYNYLLTTSESIKEVMVFGSAKHLAACHERICDVLYGEEKSLAHRSVIAQTGASAVTSLSYIVFYAYVLHLAARGDVTIGYLMLVAGAFLQCQTDLSAVVRTVAALYEHTLFVSDMWTFLDMAPQMAVAEAPIPVPPRPSVLELRSVSFRYPGTSRWVLRDLTLRVVRNESVAIVGLNGCGKTTLTKLICRLYDPDAGEVVLDGIDIRRFETGAYRSLITAVFQDFSRYQLSARENIGVAPQARIDDHARISQAARMSGAAAVIDRLPEGYETVLGTYFGQGSLLSGGEWQKVAIARALVRDAPLVVLDEPTVSLDPKSEIATSRMLQQFSKGRISILITQHLAQAALADRIVVLDGGRVAEQGSHEDLVRRGGRYAALIAMQRAMSREGGSGEERERFAGVTGDSPERAVI